MASTPFLISTTPRQTSIFIPSSGRGDAFLQDVEELSSTNFSPQVSKHDTYLL